MCCPLIGMPLLKCQVWDVLADWIQQKGCCWAWLGVVGITATLAVKCREAKRSCCNWWWCCCAIWCKTKEEKAATIIWWYIWWYTRLYCQYIMVKACFPLFPCLHLGQMYMPENSAFTWVIEVNIEQSVFLTVPAFHLDMSWSNVSAIEGALLSV